MSKEDQEEFFLTLTTTSESSYRPKLKAPTSLVRLLTLKRPFCALISQACCNLGRLVGSLMITYSMTMQHTRSLCLFSSAHHYTPWRRSKSFSNNLYFRLKIQRPFIIKLVVTYPMFRRTLPVCTRSTKLASRIDNVDVNLSRCKVVKSQTLPTKRNFVFKWLDSNVGTLAPEVDTLSAVQHPLHIK